jgi:hypothetical protein
MVIDGLTSHLYFRLPAILDTQGTSPWCSLPVNSKRVAYRRIDWQTGNSYPKTVLSVIGGSKLFTCTYISLLCICAIHPRRSHSSPVRLVHLPVRIQLTIQAFANAGDIQNAEQVFLTSSVLCAGIAPRSWIGGDARESPQPR